MPDVRYQRFAFPLAILYDELQKLLGEPRSLTLDPTEKERRNRLLAWLQENAQSGAALLFLPNWLWGRQWNALIAASIENGRCRTWRCRTSYETLPSGCLRLSSH